MKSVIFSVIIFILFSTSALAQDWKQIVPLVSNCEDVKRILKIDKCEFPITRYENPTYRAEIKFSEKACNKKCSPNEECWNVPKGTVLSASFGLNVGIALKDYESDLSSYEIKEVSDLPDSLIYISKEKGVRLTVINIAEATVENLTTYLRDISNERGVGLKILSNIAIQRASLYPSAENDKKFKCPVNQKRPINASF